MQNLTHTSFQCFFLSFSLLTLIPMDKHVFWDFHSENFYEFFLSFVFLMESKVYGTIKASFMAIT